MTDSSPHPLQTIYPRSLKVLSDQLQGLIRGRLWLKVLIGMALGLATGIVIGPSVGLVEPDIARTVASWLALPGQLFLALIQMIVIPLVFASIIRGIAASEGIEQLRRLGLRVVLYFIGTTTLAITIGLTVAQLIRPGKYVDSATIQSALGAALPKAANAGAVAAPTLAELPQKVLTLLPTNPLSAMVQAEMLGIVIFAVVVGVALVMMAPQQSKPLLDLMGSLQQVCMTVVQWAMKLAPYAVFGLLAQLTAKIGLGALLGMALYVATVLLGLVCLFAAQVLIAMLAGGRKPLEFLAAVREVLLLAFSTSSSAAVMPVSIKTAEEKLHVRPSVSQFIIPIGATINMDGTALYQGVAALFLAQVFGVDIGLAGMLLIVVTAVGASIGTPATPGVGIVILSMVLTTVNVPAAGIALIMGVDRILDMSRTAINVNGDLVASTVMDRWVGGERTYQEEVTAQEARERLRAVTGQDIVIEAPAADG